MKTVLITGADGLIGSRLSQALKPNYRLKLITAEPVEGETTIQADIVEMVQKSIEADTVQFDIFYGVSDNQNHFFDLEHAKEVLNFEPSN